MNIDRILLIFSLVSICILFYLVLKKNSIENFSGEQLSTLKEEINKQYNMDIEAIRNLGAISKSLLTGKNYHSTNTATPGTLTIPGDVVIEGKLKIAGETELNNNVFIKNGKRLNFIGNSSGKKSELFFNNSANGLEISQRGCDNLRLFQNSGGFDLKSDHMKAYGDKPFKINGDLIVTGNAEIGPAYIGKWNKTDNRHAEFSHKDRDFSSNTKYAILSKNDGTTFINTAHPTAPIYIRRNNSDKNASISYHIHRILTRYNQNRIQGHGWDDHDAGIVVWNKLENGLMEAGDILYTKGRSHNWRNHLGSVIMHPNKRDDNYWWNEVEFCNYHRHHWPLRHTANGGAHLRWDRGGDMNENLHTT